MPGIPPAHYNADSTASRHLTTLEANLSVINFKPSLLLFGGRTSPDAIRCDAADDDNARRQEHVLRHATNVLHRLSRLSR